MMSIDVTATIKQQEIKDLVAYRFFKVVPSKLEK